jgi:hypothetical protein
MKETNIAIRREIKHHIKTAKNIMPSPNDEITKKKKKTLKKFNLYGNQLFRLKATKKDATDDFRP